MQETRGDADPLTLRPMIEDEVRDVRCGIVWIEQEVLCLPRHEDQTQIYLFQRRRREEAG